MKAIGVIAAIAFVGTVYAANYAVEHWGFVSVGFGLMAPAGVYFAGLAFTLRDIVHRMLGRGAVIGGNSWVTESVAPGSVFAPDCR